MVDHSYFKTPDGTARDDVNLRLPASQMALLTKYPDGQIDYETCLPTGEIVPVAGGAYDFTAKGGRSLGGLFLDDNFTQLKPQKDGSIVVEISYPKLGYKLRIRAYDKVTRATGLAETGKLKSIQIYSPSNSNFVCVEIGAHFNNPFDDNRCRSGQKNTWVIPIPAWSSSIRAIPISIITRSSILPITEEPATVPTAAAVAAGSKVFPNSPVVTVVGSIVADIVVPLGQGSDYPVPAADSDSLRQATRSSRRRAASASDGISRQIKSRAAG